MMKKNRQKIFALELLVAIIFGPVIAHNLYPDSGVLLIVSVPVMLIVVGILILILESAIAMATGKRLNKTADKLQTNLNELEKEYSKASNYGSRFTPKKKKRKKRK
jgi:biopolymer transport protein ExbB/TolQ